MVTLIRFLIIRPGLLFYKTRLEEARAQWSRDLPHLVKELPDFDEVISELKAELVFLQKQ